MVPSKLIYINELPLTPNKKIDVKKLAELEEKYEPVRLQEYVAPSNKAENKSRTPGGSIRNFKSWSA